MKMQTFILILVILIPVCAIFYSCTYEETTINYNYYGVQTTTATPEETEFVRLINQDRASKGLPLLIHEQLASNVCRARNLQDIANGVSASHNLWEKMVRDSKIEVDNGNHIFANNKPTPQALFDAYMNSPEGHRDALELENATHIGTSIINRRNHSLIFHY